MPKPHVRVIACFREATMEWCSSEGGLRHETTEQAFIAVSDTARWDAHAVDMINPFALDVHRRHRG